MGHQPVKYVYHPSGPPTAPWAQELREVLLHSIQWSDGALVDQFVLLLSHRLSATTAQPYTSKLRKFV